ncbi:hypothetical protein ES707_03848 [subsurface metagenome]
MAELVVYPDAHPEVTSVDGHASHIDGTEQSTWAELVAGTGNSANSNFDYLVFFLAYSSATTNRWRNLGRGILLFDTSAIPADAVIISATLSIYGYYKNDDLSILPDVNVYSSAPASSIHLVIGDYDSLGSTPFCDTPITYDNFKIGDYNDFIFNAAGLAAIVKGGITKLGLRNANYDVANVAPAWSTSHSAALYAYSADKGGIYRPKLTITYALFVCPYCGGPFDTQEELDTHIASEHPSIPGNKAYALAREEL